MSQPQVRPLNKNLQVLAANELNETPSSRTSGLAELRTWLANTPHLRARTDDQFLISFLRGCKFDVDRAKCKIDSFFTIRSAVPEFFANRQITQELIDFIKAGIIVPLPDTDGPAGPRVFLFRTIYDPNQTDVNDVYKWVSMLQDIMMLEDDNLVLSGSHYVFDLKFSTMDHFYCLTSTIIRKSLTAWQNGNPFRLKGIFYINTPPIFMNILNFIRTFLNDKMRSRIKVFNENYEILSDIVPKRLLPLEYGGEAGPIADIMKDWVEKVMQYENYFKEDVKYGTDESKRPGIPRNAQTLFGLSGSFQDLDCF